MSGTQRVNVGERFNDGEHEIWLCSSEKVTTSLIDNYETIERKLIGCRDDSGDVILCGSCSW